VAEEIAMKRRELLRAGVFAGAVAALRPQAVAAQAAAGHNPAPSELTPAQSGVDATNELAGANWKPLFLDEHQNETLIILSDLIIPATDTPGAKEALVNRYIDLVLAAETHDKQREFLNALAFIDGESMRRFKSAFRYLPREEQDDVLHGLAYQLAGTGWAGDFAPPPDPGHVHFETLKDHISMAYYSSQTGTKELGWDGNFTHGVFKGCEHPEGNHA
jgi:Gluconate 2-dehydrogenase subunit 3